MGSSNNPSSGDTKPLDVAVAVMTIAGGVAAVASLKDSRTIIAVGIVTAVILVAIAAHAHRRKNKTTAGVVGVTAVLVVLTTMGYALVDGLGLWHRAKNFVQPTVSESASVLPSPSVVPSKVQTTAPPESPQPRVAYEGSADLQSGQAIDLETSNPKARYAKRLSAPDDVFIEQLAFAYDRDGYLLVHNTGEVPTKEDCQTLLESGADRGAVFAIPYTHFCARTSEDRIARIRFGFSLNGRAQSIAYTVWDR